MSLRIFYFSGTHWDREWYQTFQGFRLNLVSATNELITTLENNPAFKVFHFDGQTIVLEDYAEICPEKTERLKQLITDGRVLIGPWYCMPDEFLVSGEALIRNLQKGFALSGQWGARPWRCGYICDIFGHIAQMPQIFKGFGIDTAVVSRGTNDHSCTPFFRWVSPDNSEVITYKAPEKSGYGAFSMEVVGQRARNECVAADSQEYEQKVKEYIEGQIVRSDIPVIMIMDGMDHEPIHKEVPEYIERLKGLYPEAQIDLDDMLQAFEEAKKYTDKMTVKRGELNESGKIVGPHLHLLTHTLSSRHRIKAANDNCQTLLEKWLEPMQLIYARKGLGYNLNYLNIAWKHLLQNHPHDSICGCSVDRVHNEMFYRFSQVESIFEALMDDSERRLAGRLQIVDKDEIYNKIILVNPLPYFRNTQVEVTIPFSLDYPTWREPFGYEEICAFKLYDTEGTEVPYCIKAIHNQGVVRIFGEKTEKVHLYTVAFQTKLNASGFTTFTIVPQDKPVRYFGSLASTDGTLENRYIKMSVNPDGSIRVHDKTTGKTYDNLLSLADNGEIGDGWNSVKPCLDRISIHTVLRSVTITASNPFLSTVKIVKELSVADKMDYRISGTIRSDHPVNIICEQEISLYKDSRHLSITMTLYNNAEDHRIKLVLPTDTDTSEYEANQAFCFVKRRCGIKRETCDWKERDYLEKSTAGIVVKRSKDLSGLAFVSKGGIHECGVDDDARKTMYITLLRSFSKTYTTNGELGGQEQGIHTYHFLLVPLHEGITNTQLQYMQDDLMTGTRGFVSQHIVSDTLISVEGNVCISALKPALDDSGDLVIRIYSLSDSDQLCNVKCLFDIKTAYTCNLLEEQERQLQAEQNQIRLNVPPHKILSLRIAPKVD